MYKSSALLVIADPGEVSTKSETKTYWVVYGKGVWFLFFPVITYFLLPSSPEVDFTVFFSLGMEKKNRKQYMI